MISLLIAAAVHIAHTPPGEAEAEEPLAIVAQVENAQQLESFELHWRHPHEAWRKVELGKDEKGRFAAIMGGDSVKHRKPHPEVLHILMRRFRARPSETVMVGDSRFDMETGRRARVRLVGCLWGFGTRAELRPWKPDVTIKAGRDLPKAIAALNS